MIKPQDRHVLTNLKVDQQPLNIITAADGAVLQSESIGQLQLPNVPPGAREGRVVPGLTENLLSTRVLCQHDCTVVYTKDGVTVHHPDAEEPVLTGTLCPTTNRYLIDLVEPTTPAVSSDQAHVGDVAMATMPGPRTSSNLVAWTHACLGWPSLTTFINAVSKNYVRVQRISCDLIRKYPPNMEVSKQGFMQQERAGQDSTKPHRQDNDSEGFVERSPSLDPPDDENQQLAEVYYSFAPVASSKQMHADLMGMFPVESYNHQQYMLLMYCLSTGYIHIETMPSRTSASYVQAFSDGMTFFNEHGIKPKLLRIDNEKSQAVLDFCSENSISIEYVAPHNHRANKAERAIQTWKRSFIATLSGTSKEFPLKYWNELVPYCEWTVNILHPSATNPDVSAWERLHGHPFDFNALRLGPPGCRISVHEKANQRKSWAPRAKLGFFLGFAPNHYRGYRCLIDGNIRISDSIFFHFRYADAIPATEATEPYEIAVESLARAADVIAAGVDSDNNPLSLDKLQTMFTAYPNIATMLSSFNTTDTPASPTEPADSVPPPEATTTSEDPSGDPPPEITEQEPVISEEPTHLEFTKVLSKRDKRNLGVRFQTELVDVREFSGERPPSEGVTPFTSEDGTPTAMYRNPASTGPAPRRTGRATSQPDAYHPPLPQPSRRHRKQPRSVERGEISTELKSTLDHGFDDLSASSESPNPTILADEARQERSPSDKVVPAIPHGRRLVDTVEPDRHGNILPPKLPKRRRNVYSLQRGSSATAASTDSENIGLTSIDFDPDTAALGNNGKDPATIVRQTISETSYAKVIKGPDRDIWLEAAHTELQKLINVHQVMHFIRWSEMPRDRRATYYNPQLSVKVKNHKLVVRVRGTAGGNISDYIGQRSSSTASMETIKALINSTLSKPGWKFMSADITDFYLGSPLDRDEFMILSWDQVPPQSRAEFKDIEWRNGKALVKVTKGIYGLPQSGLLAQKRLHQHLAKAGYFPTKTACLFKHESRQTIFTIVVDDFGISYGNDDDLAHLLSTIEGQYAITTDYPGEKYVGLNLEWDYKKRTCRVRMKDYIKKTMEQFNVVKNKRNTHTPLHVDAIQYGRKGSPPGLAADDSPPLDAAGKLRIQKIVGKLLFYARAIDSTLLVALGRLSAQQATPTESTNADAAHILQYCCCHQDVSIMYHASDMKLIVTSDASYLSERKARSRAGGHFYLGDHQGGRLNGPLFIQSSIIPIVATSAFGAETAALFINTQIINNLTIMLADMGHPQSTVPVYGDNEVAIKILNDELKPQQASAMDMRYYAVREGIELKKWLITWRPGKSNLADYFTKLLPAKEHRERRSLYVIDDYYSDKQ